MSKILMEIKSARFKQVFVVTEVVYNGTYAYIRDCSHEPPGWGNWRLMLEVHLLLCLKVG